MIRRNESESHFKSVPGLVTATSEGLRVGAQTVRWFTEVYEIPETTLPIAWDGEPTRYVVYLTPSGVALAECAADAGEPPLSDAVCWLARLTLRTEGDTSESVDVEVLRRTCTMETPTDARRVSVPSSVTLPAATPERVGARARAVRIRAIDAQLAGKKASALTAADRNLVIERLALLGGMEP